MSTRLKRTVCTAAAAALAAGLAGAFTAPAVAAPLDPAADDYTRSIQLSWDGTSYADHSTESFLGTPVAIPGDTATRTLWVRNDGPTAGTLRATIVNVDLLDPDAPDEHHNPAYSDPETGDLDQGDFYDDLEIDWRAGNVSSTSSVVRGAASMNELADDVQTQILQIPLEPGEDVRITLGYELPVDATSGNRANVADRLASFDVLLELGGDLPATPTEEDPPPAEPTDPPPAEPTDPPPAEPTDPPPAEPTDPPTGSADPADEPTTPADPPAASQTQSGTMPQTGADLRWPALAVAALLALGGLLYRASRHREDVRGHH